MIKQNLTACEIEENLSCYFSPQEIIIIDLHIEKMYAYVFICK